MAIVSFLALWFVFCVAVLYTFFVSFFFSDFFSFVVFLMIRRPPRSTLDRSSAASDVYKRQDADSLKLSDAKALGDKTRIQNISAVSAVVSMQTQAIANGQTINTSVLSLIHISEPTRPY